MVTVLFKKHFSLYTDGFFKRIMLFPKKTFRKVPKSAENIPKSAENIPKSAKMLNKFHFLNQ